LKDAGYSTVLLGKYLNRYPGSLDESYVPPGWDEWYARLGPQNEFRYYDYYLNENGSTVHYGKSSDDYYTDVLANLAHDYVNRATPTQQPFFMYIAPGAPHGPWTPAERHKDMFANETAPRSPSFNEEDVSDKPEWVRALPSLTGGTISSIDGIYRNRLRTLQAVDEMVKNLVDELQAQGVLDNTYIFLMSDNGWHSGEHRIDIGKGTPYEESIRVPLVVRGPGVPAEETRNELALNTDIAPTFADLAGATVPSFVDGRSLQSLLSSNTTTPSACRSAFLLEGYTYSDEETKNSGKETKKKTKRRTLDEDSDSPIEKFPRDRTFFGIRTSQYKYVEYASGYKELYDLSADPYELDNAYQKADSTLVDGLKDRLDALKSCAEDTCRAAENGP
jgi:N-acetylglucosamine-6-sulfatase